eukprot:CAMPEP_0176036974 /NCGR_PEP_ID=MMETSP0120_2-20121206/18314_1 /TAXON_ID=160619 /ORGANISM="Kryptoperidinium foliaceum, Strain CCMP 1326" /LENGTH=479 /DNA_ID=CAMNT_0017370361 /DNA_START=50 /DNA_END=1490 /DNA_ORIENTATION=+
MPPAQRRVLIIGSGFSGLCVARDLQNHYLVTVVDAKEFFEYTPGVLRAYVKPKHLDALTFALAPVVEGRMGCKFLWGEVKHLDGEDRVATIKPMFTDGLESIDFDYCIVAAGCNFGVFHKWGESLWFPTIHADARPEGSWPHLDERFLEGRRRHILEEYTAIGELAKKKATILVVGAGFFGVEWITELEYFFKDLQLTIIDALPNCLGPLPAKAANYCSNYMKRHGIREFYNLKYNSKDPDFFKGVGMPNGPDKEYLCIGVKAANYFMPADTLSEKGPGGGGWILMDMTLAVKTRDGRVWSADENGCPRIWAIGDCNYACVEGPGKMDDWPIPPMPKISYPSEEEAIIAVKNLEKVDKMVFQGRKTDTFGNPLKLATMHWPWGAGMFATSLGPHDACFVAGASWKKNSGLMCVWGSPCAVQKEIIEASKVNECAYGLVGRLIWYFVHHTPVTFSGVARAGAIERRWRLIHRRRLERSEV